MWSTRRATASRRSRCVSTAGSTGGLRRASTTTAVSNASSEPMGETHRLKLPLTKADVQKLRVGDFVLLDGDIVLTAGLPTHERIRDHVDAGKPLPIDIQGGTLFHLGSYSREKDGKFEVLYMNPTTSTRFNPFMPDFIRHFDLRM